MSLEVQEKSQIDRQVCIFCTSAWHFLYIMAFFIEWMSVKTLDKTLLAKGHVFFELLILWLNKKQEENLELAAISIYGQAILLIGLIGADGTHAPSPKAQAWRHL